MSNKCDVISLVILIMAVVMLVLSIVILLLFFPLKMTIHDEIKGDKVITYKTIDRAIGPIYDFPALEDEHYIFRGYYSDEEGINEAHKIAKDIYVKWEPKSYFIYYVGCPEDLREKLNDLPGVRIFGEEIELLPIISSEYEFDGYYMNGEKVEKISGDAEDVVLEIRMYKN